MKEVEPGKYLVESRSKRYLMSKTKYLLFVASKTIAGAYLFACLVLGYLKLLNTSFLSYSFGPVFFAFIVAQIIIFHDLKPLTPEEAAKYKSK